MSRDIPLSLYIHLPWCVKKCPYCDFNSHRADSAMPEDAYVDALIRDLDYEAATADKRELVSIFFGGGTPSLFEPRSIERILTAARERLPLAADCEITLEANPGTVEAERFAGYRTAGVNRLSIGVQSLDDTALTRLGRIHDANAARQAVTMARAAGFDNLNLDMMFGLPDQTPAAAEADLARLMELAPEHISYYQLTLEPGTPFFHRPPSLAEADTAWQMQERSIATLTGAGYQRYEVSAWSRPGHACRHNENYWRFGDYIGIGAGAHGKVTDLSTGAIQRRAKQPMPKRYMQTAGDPAALGEARTLEASDRLFEFLMNALRLDAGFTLPEFETRTGLPPQQAIDAAERMPQLLHLTGECIRCTALGRLHLDSILAELLPEAA